MEAYTDLFVMIIALLAGVVGIAPINWIKDLFSWEDKQAFLLASGVSLVLGVLVVVISGEVFPLATVTAESIMSGITAAITSATVIYKVFVSAPEDPFGR